MILTIFIFSISAFIYLFLGIYVFKINPKKRINQIFFFICLFYSIQCFAGVFLQSQKNPSGVLFWYKVAAFSYLFDIFLTVLFCIFLTKIMKKKIFYILLFLPNLYFLTTITLFMNNIVSFNFNKVWMFKYEIIYPGFMVFYIYVLVYSVLNTILLMIWFRKVKTKKEKKQALIILITLLISFSLKIFDDLVISAIFKFRIPGGGAIFPIIFMIGICFTMIRYRFLTLTPEIVSKMIIENISEIVIFFNPYGKVIEFNKNALMLFGNSQLKEKNLDDLFAEKNILDERINKINKGTVDMDICRINFFNSDKDKILLDVNVSIIKDKFGDVIGILIIGDKIEKMHDFKDKYEITKRENEIIQLIISGKSNKEIACLINITERTMKSHITNIYSKLNVANKIQLLNLLKNHDLY